MLRLYTPISLLLIVLLLLFINCNKPAKEVKRIVLIHSFGQDHENYALFNDEIIKEFGKQGIEADLHTFYLDCEQFNAVREVERIYHYIDTIRHQKPDLILVNDDQATYSLLACDHPFVKEVPIIFAGVNYPNWGLLKKYPNVTGWHDKQDFVKNIEFIHALFGCLDIHVAYDLTALGKKAFPDILQQIRPNKNITITRSRERLADDRKDNKDDAAAFQILRDSTKNYHEFENPSQRKELGQVVFAPLRLLSGSYILSTLSKIEEHSVYLDTKYDFISEAMPTLVRYPSFSAHNEPIPYSPDTKSRYIGGYLTSIEIQAREQVQTAVEVLKGQSVNQIPIKQSAKEYILAWAPAKAWGLPYEQIPSYVRVIGIPFQERHKTAIIWITAIAFATIIAIAALLGSMYMREEKHKKEAQNDLIKQNKRLAVALEKAEESDRMKSAFLANMSHEIRTPLNAIVGFSNLLNEDMELEKEERKQFQGLINTNSDLLLNLINDILDLSRIESGRMAFSFGDHDLSELIHNIYSTFLMMMPTGVKLQIELPDDSVTIYTDKHRLMQVITNFLNNAIKFTTEGYIKVGYTYDAVSRLVHISVEDTGKGIAKEKQAAVFERFTKLDEFARGTGLGLSICKVITERFSGRISVSSEEGKGSRFTVTLPLKPKDIG